MVLIAEKVREVRSDKSQQQAKMSNIEIKSDLDVDMFLEGQIVDLKLLFAELSGCLGAQGRVVMLENIMKEMREKLDRL